VRRIYRKKTGHPRHDGGHSGDAQAVRKFAAAVASLRERNVLFEVWD
jgi:hypothetical protein